MKNILSIILTAIVIITTSCSTNPQKIITAYGDGPYIRIKGDSSLVTFQTRNRIFDSIMIKNTEISNIIFKCEFDSISCPPLSFCLNRKYDISDTISVFRLPEKLLTLSDIEGNYEKFYGLLLSNNVIDSNYNWTFGDGQLIILGDLLDRGNYATQCLWLAYHLEGEAIKHGGKVDFLLGNHEQLVLLGFDDYCAPKYHRIFKELNTDILYMFSEHTELGSRIRSKNSMIKVGDYLFVHGGISPSLLKHNLSLGKINSEVKRDIDTDKFATDESEALLCPEGILWYRGMVENEDGGAYKKITEQEIDSILKHFDCKTVVIGHTPVDNISKDINSKVIRIDVDHYENSSALLIENGKEYIVDYRGKRTDLR